MDTLSTDGSAAPLTGRPAASSDEFGLALAIPSIGMISAWCVRRSIRATAQDALVKTLLDAAADDMNFAMPGLDDLERARRTAFVQLALDLNGYPVGRIDGICGGNTQKQLDAFADRKGIKSGDINDPNLRRALVRALHSGAWDLAKR